MRTNDKFVMNDSIAAPTVKLMKGTRPTAKLVQLVVFSMTKKVVKTSAKCLMR